MEKQTQKTNEIEARKLINNDKLVELFDNICDMNKEYINKDKNFTPRAFIVKENYDIGIVFLPFKDNIEKQFTKQMLKKLILSEKILGYIFSSDTFVTSIDIKTRETKVLSGLTQILFTPKGSIGKTSLYDEKKFTEEINFDGSSGGSDWNVWNMTEHDEKLEEEYSKFRNDHPEFYGDKK